LQQVAGLLVNGHERDGVATFVGSNCGLCSNPNWDVRSKKLAE